MKIRSGFVSNSSSSSFIFIFENNSNDSTYDENYKWAKEDWIDSFGDDDLERFEEYVHYIDDNHSFVVGNIEYGGEETLLPILKKLNIKIVDIDY